MSNKNQNKNLNSFHILMILVILANIFVFNSKEVLASPMEKQILVELTNKERLLYGRLPLKNSTKLNIAAENKARDMLEDDYFEHYSPLGTSPWDFIKTAQYDYVMAGENLAMDFATSEGIVRAWMASPSHKRNILREGYEDIGIAAVKGEFIGQETTMVVQMFGKPLQNTNKINTIIWKVTSWILGL